MDAWKVPLDHISRPIDRSALYFCGFPTLQHIRHKVWVYVCECVDGPLRDGSVNLKRLQAQILSVMLLPLTVC